MFNDHFCSCPTTKYPQDYFFFIIIIIIILDFHYVSFSEPEADAEVCAEGHGGTLHRGDERRHQLAQGRSFLLLGDAFTAATSNWLFVIRRFLLAGVNGFVSEGELVLVILMCSGIQLLLAHCN